MTLQENDFFAPSTTSPIEYLLNDFEKEKVTIDEVAIFMQKKDVVATLPYFKQGMNERQYSSAWVFDAESATKALSAKYWGKALAVTDVLDFMPSKKRDEWKEQVSSMQTPAFEAETVHATLKTLLAQRMDFLAEMVDGIFTGLSREHITNRPEAFCKRMIIDCVCDAYSSYGDRKIGLIHDMRCVIAKLMGRDENVPYCTTRSLIRIAQTDLGQWFNVDGNAFRIRVYKKGTAHLEINQDIAYRLNQILAYLHPMAIPAPHKKRPNKKPAKGFELMERPLPFAVLDSLSLVTINGNTLSFTRSYFADKHVHAEVCDVLMALGGVRDGDNFVFGYDIRPILNHVIASGVMPDQKTHQFYPTNSDLARKIVENADIQSDDSVLEPSAGQGGIIDAIGDCGGVTAIEASGLHCKILAKKIGDTNVICGDFLKLNLDQFDKIVMNPPFSQGRAKAHVQHAVTMLAEGGRLVAILPASFYGKDIVDGMTHKWHGIHDNEFARTSVSVAILELTHR